MAFDFKKEYKEYYMPKSKPQIVDVPKLSAEFLTIDEGLCVQIMYIGPFDDEPATVARMDAYPEKWKTVIRHPIKRA